MIKKKLLYPLSLLLMFIIGCSAQQKPKPIKAPPVIYKNSLPLAVRDCWQNLDIEKDTLAGTSLNRAYQDIIKNKKGKEVIVAVIDNYMDVYHEDLKSAIWVNKKEVPNNGIDDDHNGYVDDINGWNFLGNPNGDDLVYANTESTRIIRSLKKKYSNFPSFNKNSQDSVLYIKATERYKADKDFLGVLQKQASENLKVYRSAQANLRDVYKKTSYSLKELDSLYKSYSKVNVDLAKRVSEIRRFHKLGKDYQILLNDSLKIEDQFKITYNENYYDRTVLGDEELNLSNIGYGSNNMWKNAKYNYHGTIVAGVIGANRANKIGIEGFSDQIKIMAIRTTPSGGSENDKDVALAIRYAVDNGAKVINMSFGKTLCAHPEWIKEAFIYAQKHGVLLIAGAGNNSWDNDIHPFYPIDYDENTGEEYCNNFIKVGAISLDGDKNFLAPFTNYGKKTVDIFAPGYYLKTTDPNGGYSYRDGTSMASPIVSGVAALVRSHYPKLTASQIKQIILESGVSYDLQVQVPGEKEGELKPFSEMSKSGKVVNAYNALLMAEQVSKGKKKLEVIN
jgi:cell wall-associated protease